MLYCDEGHTAPASSWWGGRPPGDQRKSQDQLHAKQIADAPQTAAWSEGKEGEPSANR
jgi:hypothetical protein